MENIVTENVTENVALKYIQDQESTLVESPYVSFEDLKSCCIDTVDSHAEINPIMVCGTCRHIIKCFHDERSYKNFLHFCHSRGRSVKASKQGAYFVVVYKSHGNI